MQNTYSTAIVIGEKAASIIAAELGIALEPEHREGEIPPARAHL